MVLAIVMKDHLAGDPRQPRRAQENPGEHRKAQESTGKHRRAQGSPGEPRRAQDGTQQRTGPCRTVRTEHAERAGEHAGGHRDLKKSPRRVGESEIW